MQLNEGKIGKKYKVEEIQLALKTERRMEALGMTCGTVITFMNKKRHGAIIIKVRGTRFALGRSIAEKIQVEEVQGDEV